ncbi:MAG TPA: PqqD family protein [Vicinamibacterales bacterium]|nr:PqqD family protein [Vicinamibacterales bacterium]
MSQGAIAPHPDVVDTELDGHETVLLHLGTKKYFSLNATGSVIWQCLKQGLEREAIARELQRRYDVSAERAAQSVTILLDALVEQRLACHREQ